MTKKNMGFCVLCHSVCDLQKSHAIPNAYIKPILEASGGNLIAFTSGDEKNYYTSESHKERKLCRVCEGIINNAYENPSVALLRGVSESIEDCGNKILIKNYNIDVLRSFFSSIYWRLALWDDEKFQNITLEAGVSEEIRVNLISKNVVSSGCISVRLWKIVDASKAKDKILDFSHLLLLPVLYRNKRMDTLRLIFSGYLIEMNVGGFNFNDSKKNGVLRDGASAVYIPKINFYDIPELVRLAAIARKKEAAGHTAIKLNGIML